MSHSNLCSRLVLSLSLIAVLTSCFEPSYPSELACGPDDFCPPGQVCSAAKICFVPGQMPLEPDANVAADARSGLGNLETISIGGDLMLSLADTHTFVVTATYENGSETVDNALVIWRSSDSALAFTDFQGIVHPQSPGTVTLSADLLGRVATITLTVLP